MYTGHAANHPQRPSELAQRALTGALAAALFLLPVAMLGLAFARAGR